jgi:glycosyltransferase involved in cell wall biosynthesis
MKVCIVHNAYGRLSGEEVAVDGLAKCLTARGHEVIRFDKTSEGFRDKRMDKLEAFFSGIYSFQSRREFSALLQRYKPNIVHVNNLFPLISPSILEETAAQKVPAVMTLHNYRLLCPTGLLMVRGELCDRCVKGSEWWCAIKSCAGERSKSIAYALRSWIARQRSSFDMMSKFIAPTDFVKSVMVRYGYAPERIAVVPYALNWDWTALKPGCGNYVGFAGRISPEKGIEVIVEAARKNPLINFRFAGHYLQMPEVVRLAPTNCTFLGPIEHAQLGEFFAGSRFTIFCSTWYEALPVSLLEAMAHGKAVVVSNLGSPAEVVDDGRIGMHFEAGNAEDLATKIRFLWERPQLCQLMGQRAREKVLSDYSLDKAYAGILDVYSAAIEHEVHR